MSEPQPVEQELQEEPRQEEPELESPSEEAPREGQPVQAAIVPVPDTLRGGQKTPFWRRIRLGRGGKRNGLLSGSSNDDRILGHLDAIAAQLTAGEQSVAQRIDQLDEKFSEVWEVEETLSRLTELRELLTELKEGQGQLDTRLRGLQGRLTLIAAFAGLATAAALAAAFFAFAA